MENLRSVSQIVDLDVFFCSFLCFVSLCYVQLLAAINQSGSIHFLCSIAKFPSFRQVINGTLPSPQNLQHVFRDWFEWTIFNLCNTEYFFILRLTFGKIFRCECDKSYLKLFLHYSGCFFFVFFDFLLLFRSLLLWLVKLFIDNFRLGIDKLAPLRSSSSSSFAHVFHTNRCKKLGRLVACRCHCCCRSIVSASETFPHLIIAN